MKELGTIEFKIEERMIHKMWLVEAVTLLKRINYQNIPETQLMVTAALLELRDLAEGLKFGGVFDQGEEE